MGDGSCNYDEQKRFIDYAAAMGWRYTLIDALWDRQIGYERVKELIDYAATKGVKILLWYNSAGSWNGAPQTPRSMLLTHESRVKEFLKHVPAVWNDIRFLAGEPGKFVALARQGDDRWFVAGINGNSAARTLTLDLAGLSPKNTGTLIADGAPGNLSFRRETVTLGAGQQLTLTLPAHGGFVLTLD